MVLTGKKLRGGSYSKMDTLYYYNYYYYYYTHLPFYVRCVRVSSPCLTEFYL